MSSALDMTQIAYPTKDVPPPPEPTVEERQGDVFYAYESLWRTAFATSNFNPDALINAKGWDAIDDMLTLAVYNGPLRLKKFATLYKPLEVISLVQSAEKDPAKYDRSQKAADLVRYVMENIHDPETGDVQSPKEVAWYMCDAYHYGFSVQEMTWRFFDDGPYKDFEGLRRFTPRNPRQIRFWLNAKNNRVEAINSWTPTGGHQWRESPKKFLRYSYLPTKGLPFGSPDSRNAYKHVFSINEAYRIWGIFVERNAAGFLHGKTKNQNQEYHRRLMTLLNGVRQGGSLVTYGDVEVEWQQVTGAASPSFMHFVDHHYDQIVKLMLGQSLTTGIGDGKGSYSLGSVHEGTQEFILAHARTDICNAIRNQVFRQIVWNNLGPAYMDVVPLASLGLFNIKERQAIATFLETFSKFGDMVPNEPEWRRMCELPPLDTVARDEYIAQQREEASFQSSLTQKDTSSGSGSGNSNGGGQNE